MKQRKQSRAAAIGALLMSALILSGCAAGSPAIVAPETPEGIVAQAPVAPIPAPAGPADSAANAAAPADLASAPAPETDTAPAPVTEAPADMAAAPETAVQEAPPQGDTTATAAFAQDVPLPDNSPTTDGGTLAQSPAVTPPADSPAEAAPAETDPAVDAAPIQTSRPAPPPDPGTGLSEMVQGGPSDGQLEVALTFDAGADTGYAAEILDVLRDAGIHATFGMTGVYAQANPDLVRRMVDEGHQLINHTWDHPSLTGANTGMPALTPEQVAQQLWDTENVVSEATGGYQMLPYFRPPYGDYDATSLGYLANNGYYLSIWWTCDSHGWDGWDAQKIIDYCSTNLAEDEIILLHVGAAAAGDFAALPGLIQSFRDKGYAFVTVEEMLQP